MNILAVGDIVGTNGLGAFKRTISLLKKEHNIDICIVNGENSSQGRGITKDIFNDLITFGADVITMGNHTWGRKDIFEFIDEEEKLIRPANYAEDLPGKGYFVFTKDNKKIAVINLIGRVDMGSNYDCPFKKADEIVDRLKNDGVDIIIIDFHAEATAEKKALAYYLKDKVNIVFGTHTHVQTADEEIYDTGLGYITDIGMTGPKNSIIGMDVKAALKRFLTQIPERYVVAEGESFLNAVVFELDDATNKTINIKRIKIENI